eukprot:gene18797-12472_t
MALLDSVDTDEQKGRWAVLSLWWATHALVAGTSRIVFEISLPTMVESPDFVLEQDQLPWMLTSGTISTIAGKLVAGPVCAALGPKHVGWLSLLACALPLVTASNGYSVLVAWNIARFGQSMTWPVTNILFDAWFPSDEQGKAWGVMGTSSRAGILSLTLALNLFGDGLDTAALF